MSEGSLFEHVFGMLMLWAHRRLPTNIRRATSLPDGPTSSRRRCPALHAATTTRTIRPSIREKARPPGPAVWAAVVAPGSRPEGP